MGPPGCGKSEAIKTFALAEKERGKTVDIQSLFNRALETDELFGYTDPDTRSDITCFCIYRAWWQKTSLNRNSMGFPQRPRVPFILKSSLRIP